LKKIRFAIVGCGHIGKRHTELVFQHQAAQLVATIDPLSEETCKVVKYEIPHFHNLDDFLKSGIKVDVVNICTPNGLHAKQAVECLDHGLHVVVEKPIALKMNEAQEILEAAKRNNRDVFPVVQNRYSSTVKWLKKLVNDNALGDIYMIQLNCFWNRDEHYYTKGSWHGTLALDGGPLYTQFSHFIDVLNWIFGKIKKIDANFYNFNHQQTTEFEDSGLIKFEMINGAAGTISYSTSVFQSNFESSVTVIAEKGTVKIGGQYMNCIEYCQVNGTDKPASEDHHFVNDYGSYKGSASNHQQVIDNVVDVVNGLTKPDVSLQDGIDVVEIISEIYQYRNMEKIGLAKEKQLV